MSANVAALARLLHETAEHGAFEKVAPKHDWWDGYAAYMDARERGQSLASYLSIQAGPTFTESGGYFLIWACAGAVRGCRR